MGTRDFGWARAWRWAVVIVLCTSFPLAGHTARLSKDPLKNQDLATGNYRFWEYHLPWTGSFEDEWSFSLARPSRISLEARSIERGFFGLKLLDIDDLSLTLVPEPTSSRRLLHAVLDSGTYRFLVAGDVRGIFGGRYVGNLGVSAVPLPPALVLFGCALLALTGINRMRARRASRSVEAGLPRGLLGERARLKAS